MPRPGYVYLMRLEQDSDPLKCAHKIGKSVDVPQRNRQIGIALPYELTVVHMVPVQDMDWCETLLHSVYTRGWLRGEWFKLDQDGIDTFCRLTSEDLDIPDEELPF